MHIIMLIVSWWCCYDSGVSPHGRHATRPHRRPGLPRVGLQGIQMPDEYIYIYISLYLSLYIYIYI